jgi:uncharacterized protein YraI
VKPNRLTAWLVATTAGLLIAVTACTSSPATLDATQLSAAGEGTLQAVGTQAALADAQTAIARWLTGTQTPSATPTHTATQTPTSTASATDTLTMTPTAMPSGTFKASGALLAGPGRVYAVVATVKAGQVGAPLGQTAAGDWYQVSVADKQGWVTAANFQLATNSPMLPIITNIPPTPTVPPATATSPSTPTPEATSTNGPSAYACNVTVQRGVRGGGGAYIVFVGTGWPPDVDVDLTIRMSYGSVRTWPAFAHSGKATSLTPYGFWMTMQDPTKAGNGSGTGVFEFSTGTCTTTVAWP